MSFNTESRVTRTGATGTATHTQYATTRSAGLITTAVWWLRTGRAVRRVATAVLRWVAGTVTPAGWAVALATLVLLPLGLVLGWAELTAAGLLGAALLVLALPFLLGGRAYSIDFTLPVERVVAGGEVVGTLRVSNIARRPELPGRIDVPIGAGLTDVYVPLLRPGHEHRDEVTVPTLRRGVIEVGPVTTVRTDPIGLLRREVAWADVHQLYVHPVTVPIPSTSAGFVRDLEGNPTSDIVDDDMSFHAIRDYAAGDGQRHIHWKSTAKTGDLMVRQFEESRRSRLAVVLALAAEEFGSADEFELAVSVVGSLGVRAVRDGRDLAVATSEEIPEFARETIRSIRSLSVLSSRALLDELCEVESSPHAMPVEQVCTLATQVVPDMSIAFVVCGSTMTPRRLRALPLRFASTVSVVAVVCDPEASPGMRKLGPTTVITVGVLDDLKGLLARWNR